MTEDVQATSSRRASKHWDCLPWLAALGGFLLACLAFFPGYMSWDSAYQWWQARHDVFDATHPPLMAMLWQLTDGVLPGPGGLFLLQQALIWGALATFAQALPLHGGWRAVLVLVLGLWPPLFGLSAYLWKDLWTELAFAWAVGLLAIEWRRPSMGLRLLALAAIAAACAFRHNAISGALPLLVWWAWRRWPRLAAGGALRLGGAGLLLTGAAWAASKLPNLDPRVQPVDSVWSVVTLWDAAAVSLREGHLVYPQALIEPGLGLDELRQHFLDYSNTTVYETGKLKHSFGRNYTPAERQALRGLALDLPLRHSRSYFAHRWQLSRMLYGWDRERLPDGQVLAPGLHAYGDNPPLAPARSELQAWTAQRLQGLIDTPWFAGWWYLAGALLVATVAALQLRHCPAKAPALAVAASSLGYALPLALVSGSAEFRYLAWPVLASLLAMCLWAFPPRAEPTG